MLYLDKYNLDTIFGHCVNAVPNEACGILAGKDSKVQKVYPMTNTDKSPTSYFMDPKEQFKVIKQIRGLDLEMVGVYHSHPDTEAYPSNHDVDLAFYPQASYVIVSVRDKNNPDIRSFKIIDGKISEEEVNIE